MTQTKVCSKCGVEKEVGEFRPLKNAKDGFRWNCRECERAKNKAWRELNINLSTVTGRLDVHGWSVEDAFGTPTRKGFVERNKTKNAVAPVDEGIL